MLSSNTVLHTWEYPYSLWDGNEIRTFLEVCMPSYCKSRESPSLHLAVAQKKSNCNSYLVMIIIGLMLPYIDINQFCCDFSTSVWAQQSWLEHVLQSVDPIFWVTLETVLLHLKFRSAGKDGCRIQQDERSDHHSDNTGMDPSTVAAADREPITICHRLTDTISLVPRPQEKEEVNWPQLLLPFCLWGVPDWVGD